MRHTKGHTGNRRSHHGLNEPRFSKCPECGAEHLRHTACMSCGTYRGRAVIDVKAINEHKAARRAAKLKALGQEVEKESESNNEDKS